MTDTQQSSQTMTPVNVPPEIASAPPISAVESNGGELVAMPQQTDVPAKAGYASEHGGYINSYIALADTKAAWLFAIPAAGLAYLAGQPEFWSLVSTPGAGWLKLLAVIATIALLGSAAAAFAVIVPRLGGSPRGIFYFGAVAARTSADSFLDELAPMSESDLLNARLRHNFEIARLCRRKYRALRVATWIGLIGLTGMLALVSALKLVAPTSPAPPAKVATPANAPKTPAAQPTHP